MPALLSASAIGYYGDTGDRRSTSRPAGGGFLAEVCRDWEAATAPPRLPARGSCCCARGGALPGGGLLGRLRPLFTVLGGRIGSGRQYLPWISLDDEVGAIRFLLENDPSGPVNLAGPEQVTNAQFTRALARRSAGRRRSRCRPSRCARCSARWPRR